MLKQYPTLQELKIEEWKDAKLSKAQKEELDKYVLYREGRGLSKSKVSDLRREMIQIYCIIKGNIKQKLSNETEVIRLSLIIKNSHYGKESKINMFVNLKNALKRIHNDWVIRFKEFEMLNTKQFNKGDDSETKDYDLLNDEEIKKIYRTEHRLFYKCFFKVSEQTALRGKEERTIENKNIEFNDDGTSTIKVFMTKTGKKKFVFCDSETTQLIKQLQQEQKNTGKLGKYLFHTPKDNDNPISKNQVCYWFRSLTQKAIGRKCVLYQLRHRRATILYKLAKENKISTDTATDLLGHSKDMSDRYTHISEEERIEILKKQAFTLKKPLTTEEKDELEKLRSDFGKLRKDQIKTAKILVRFLNKSEGKKIIIK